MDPERAAKTSVTREMPPLLMRAEVAPASIDEKNRTVDVVWTTGERVLRGWWDQYYEELDMSPGAVRMGRLQSGKAPLLNAHQSYDLSDQIGVVQKNSARLEGAVGVATVRFARDPESETIFQKVADGIIGNLSIGYRIHKLEKVEANEGQIPVMRATDWEPYEISFVPVGADAGAMVRAEARSERGTPNPCVFIEERKQMAITKPVDKPAATETEVTKSDDGAQRAAAAAADERARILAIQSAARSLKIPPEAVARYIADGTSADKVRELELVEFERRSFIELKSHEPIIQIGDSEKEKRERAMEAWLIQRAGMSEIVRAHAKKIGQPFDAEPGEFRGMRLLELAREFVEAGGAKTRGMSDLDMVGRAFTMPSQGMLASTQKRAAVGVGAASSSDFPILLQNVLHKVLLAAYGTVPDTWSQFCITGSVMDFRPHNRYRMGTFGGLSTVNEGAEFPNKPIGDGTVNPISAQTKGNIIAITRQAIINDDMDAFSRLAGMFGRAARLSIELDVYALLAQNSGNGPTMSDGNALFSSAHGNLTTGAALGSAALDLDRQALAKQTDISGNEILDLRPAVLLLGIGQGAVARQIIQSQYDYDVTGKFQIANRVLGLVGNIIDSPRIATTRRYLFAEPGIAPTIEVAFLQGQQSPYMESQLGWRIDATEWKIRLDYGVAAVDWKGAVSNVGA